MDANPLTDRDLEAFCRRRLIRLSAWQKDLMFRLDDAALGAVRGDRRREREAREAANRDPRQPINLPPSHTKGIRALLTDIATRKRAQAAAKAARNPD